MSEYHKLNICPKCYKTTIGIECYHCGSQNKFLKTVDFFEWIISKIKEIERRTNEHQKR